MLPNPVITEHIVLAILFMDSLLNHCAENMNCTFCISKFPIRIKISGKNKNRTDGHGPLQTVLAVKALAMDCPMPHSFLHQIVCDIVDKSNQLTKEDRV